MAAPGGILHKVQLHFEKCIQFTAVSALSFSPVFFPLGEKKEKEKKHSRNIFASPPPLASVFMLRGVRRSSGDWGVMIYLYRNIRNKNTNVRVWIVFKLDPALSLSLLLLFAFCSSAEEDVPQQHVNCTICISNGWYPMGLGSKNTSKRRWTIVK